jgi:hypothetical protein
VTEPLIYFSDRLGLGFWYGGTLIRRGEFKNMESFFIT